MHGGRERRPPSRIGAIVLFTLAAATSAGAQAGGGDSLGNAPAPQLQRRPPAQGSTRGHVSPWLPRLRLDNDAYNFWIHPGHRTDEEYTNGVVASFETLRAPLWGARLGGGAPGCGADTARTTRCLTTTLAIGQDMYTPNLRRPPFSSPDWQDERPYAGWLYLGATGRSISHRTLRAVDVQLGVTGKPALGQVSQRVAHWINSAYTLRATGWETQVGFQPGVQLGYTHALLAARGSLAGRGVFDLVPTASAVVGTARTRADAGARLRLGYNLSHPFDPRRWRARSPLEFFVSAAGRAGYVARDFSLDGSLMEDGRRVERVPGVREYAFGTGLRMQRVLFLWEATTRSREYTTGPSRHTFSSMSASWEFYR